MMQVIKKENINNTFIFTVKYKGIQFQVRSNNDVEDDLSFVESHPTTQEIVSEIDSIGNEPTQQEIDEYERLKQLKTDREQAKSELKASLPPQSNPELAKRVEKLEFIIGIRDEIT